jgi:hypothetical protein
MASQLNNVHTDCYFGNLHHIVKCLDHEETGAAKLSGYAYFRQFAMGYRGTY